MAARQMSYWRTDVICHILNSDLPLECWHCTLQLRINCCLNCKLFPPESLDLHLGLQHWLSLRYCDRHWNRWTRPRFIFSVCVLSSDFCSPRYCSLPGSSFHIIFQAGILEWVAGSCSTSSLEGSFFNRDHGLQTRDKNVWKQLVFVFLSYWWVSIPSSENTETSALLKLGASISHWNLIYNICLGYSYSFYMS